MLKINVGLSRKVTQDYQSRGFSLNIEGELPSDVLSHEHTLADATNRLFEAANLLLDEQVSKATDASDGNRSGGRSIGRVGRSNGNGGRNTAIGYANGGDQHNGRRHQNATSSNGDNGERLLTQAQGRAIANMTRKLDLNADKWVDAEFEVESVNKLTVKQASQAIELLKENIERPRVTR